MLLRFTCVVLLGVDVGMVFDGLKMGYDFRRHSQFG